MTRTSWMNPQRLHPDPLNTKLYGIAEPTDLLASIREHGVLEPIVCLPDFRILSGHRRHAACIALGLPAVPVRVVRKKPSASLLVSFNRQRRKTWTQLSNEIDALLPECRRKAAERKRVARHAPKGRASPDRTTRRAIDDVAKLVGLAREAVRQLLYIQQARPSFPGVDDVIRKLDAGLWSLNRAYMEVRRIRLAAGQVRRGEIEAVVSRCIRSFDLWQFRERETAFDVQRVIPGTPAPQVFVNIVHHFSMPGELVIDPMANDGIVGRIAIAMGRRAQCLDLNPRHATVCAWDVRSMPEWIERGSASLVVLDPPFGSMMAYSAHPNDLARVPNEAEFQETLQHACLAWAGALRSGGRLALLIGNEVRSGKMIDRVLSMATFLARSFSIERRIWVPYPQSAQMGKRIGLARRTKCLATRQCELIVAAKE